MVQPPRHLAHLVASRSYLSYNKKSLKDKFEHNSYSYLQVINPDATDDIAAERGTVDFFKEVRKGYDKFLDSGWLEGTEGPVYAVYRQMTPLATFTGIIAVLDLPKCEDGGVLTHELTLEKREDLFVSYLETVGFHAEPILCARKSGHEGEDELNSAISDITESREADCDFTTTDCIRHSVWLIHSEINEGFSKVLEPIETLYIADGHHRLASSIKMLHRHPNEPGVDRILAFILPAKELSILGYHREVRNWNGDIHRLLTQIKAIDSVLRIEKLDTQASCGGCIDIITNQGEWRLVLKEDHSGTRIDAGWLNDEVLEPLLGIEDSRNSPNLKYIAGSNVESENTSKLKEVVKGHNNKIVFALHPIPIDQIISVSDAGNTLPPKSTWVEPKLRSGLFVYEFGLHPHKNE
tara:strand:- start:112 stop:1338 length:1227 start_codon:yes stop_codon:yes gene_type:complete